MVGVARDEGGGRRLPSWMMGVSTADRIGKSDNNSKAKKKDSEEEFPSRVSRPDPGTKKTRRGKESSVVEEETLPEESPRVLVKCKTKRRNRKESPEDNADSEKKCNGARRKLSEPASCKRLKTRDYESREELEIQPEDEDVELTVEDLMTIAKEYVSDDKNMEQDQAPKRTGEQKYKPTTVSSRTESIDNNNRVRIRNETTISLDIGASRDQTKIAFSEPKSGLMEETVPSAGGTGDPARDMLDLLLGPLLKKPVGEKKSDFPSKDVAFSMEFGIQNKTNIVREETAPPPPMAKKKSSLKDKIAMFLD